MTRWEDSFHRMGMNRGEVETQTWGGYNVFWKPRLPGRNWMTSDPGNSRRHRNPGPCEIYEEEITDSADGPGA